MISSGVVDVFSPPDTPLPNETYCLPSEVNLSFNRNISGGVGIWGSFSESCGQFGTRERTRNYTFEAYGCPCFKSDVGPCQISPCPAVPCPKSVAAPWLRLTTPRIIAIIELLSKGFYLNSSFFVSGNSSYRLLDRMNSCSWGDM